MKLRERLDGPRGTMIAIIVAIAVAALVMINFVYGYAWSVESRTTTQRARAHAEQLARALGTYASMLQSQAEALAGSAAIARDLEEGREPALPRFPALHSIQLVRLGELGIAASTFSPATLNNNVEINLVGAAFNGERPPPEAILAKDKWVLSAAARLPRPDAAGNTGVIVLRADLQALLRDFVSTETADGSLSLHLVGANGRHQSLSATSLEDAPARDAFSVATGVGRIDASFKPSAAFLASAAVSGITLMAAIAGGALVLIGLVGFAFRQLRMQMRSDAARLRELTLHHHDAAATAPTLHYSALEPVGEAILELRRRQQELRARSAADAGNAAAAVAVAVAAEADSLEIEMLDDSDSDAVRFEGEAKLKVPAEVFRDYDIRGRNALLTPQLAQAIGQAIGSEALERGMSSLVVGADGRESSPELRERLVQGLVETGVDVIDVGTVATPMLYFACHHLHTKSGVMVTGSHNPADHNGFKIMIDGETLCGERIGALRERILAGRFAEGQGSYRVTEIDADYTRAIADDVLVDAPLKVVVDCGNGAASVIAVELFEMLGCDVVPLFCELDGRFPNHPPDPSVPGNLRHLLAEVARQHADLGIAFDGDADRLGVVTSTGSVVMADRLLMLFARDLLSRNPGADVVFDVKCSRDLPGVIVQHGGRPIMCRSGHSWIKEKMKETGALLGGEFTGHICFKDRWFGFDDALYAAARLLEIVTASDGSLDGLLTGLPHAIGTPELSIAVPEERKFELMQSIADGIALEGARLIRIDGVRAEFRDGWGLLRASNTSAALTCRFEASSQDALHAIQEAFHAELLRLVPGVELPF